MGSETCRTLLINTKVSGLKQPQVVAVLKDSATVDQALKVLAENKILSAPVVVAQEGDDASQSATVQPGEAADILGFVDIKNILDSFLSEIDIPELNQVKLLQRMRELEERGAAFAEKPLKELKYMGTDGDFIHASQARSTLLELVLNGLLQPRNRGGGRGGSVVHRIALFNSDGAITQIISQTDIVKFLARHKEQLGPLSTKTVEELGLVSGRVECIDPGTPAIEAMAAMSYKGLSSLAVVDPNGKILGNFSVSDMRTLMAEHFGALALPVGEFLAHEHRTEYVAFNRVRAEEEGIAGRAGHKFVVDRVARQRPRTPGEEVGQELVLARPGQTLVSVMELLVARRIHRVYVVDEEEKPVGIITCTDILRKLLQMAQ
uniref:CBS domain-containing protein n=1 Tax=Chlamydomonas leiostraca TaxID=1034604 RepID=A0A7S0X0C9_9CHLO|mmetsp:Transcript_37325/g.94131  ORF Transcript_37325/g.94131 Transcript_37325/m.94131 type:complete len:377 (+) Transcript_37325:158-1288(+)